MQPQRRSARLLLLASLAAGACTEQTLPTAVPDGLHAVAAANNDKIKVRSMQLSSNTLRINGPSVSGQLSVSNSGPAIPTNVYLRGTISQGSAGRPAVDTPMQCSSAPGDAGKLPNGSCTMTFSASASNLATGPGTLVPGSATFTLRVVEVNGTTETELASKALLVNLVGTQSLAMTVAPIVLIDGKPATATAVIQNPASTLQGVSVQGYIVQGTAPNQTRRPTGTSLVTCGSNAGVLPPGTCTMTVSVAASNVGDGVGLFASGAATFELSLIQTSGATSTTIDAKTAPTMLVWGSPHMTRVELQSTSIQLGGDDVAYTVDIQNGGAPRTNIFLGVQIHQSVNGQQIVKSADGVVVPCGGAPGDLPTTGTGVCTIQSTLNAPDDANGGALVPGPAVLFFDLFDLAGPPVLHREQVNITLLAGKPVRISEITISPTVPLGSGTAPYTARLTNEGPALTPVVLQAWITQGIARRAAGGQQVLCNGGPVGELPTGTCTQQANVAAQNAPALGTGTLIPGPAMLEIHLDQQGSTPGNLDKKFIPITLTMTTTGIVAVELSAPNVLIGESLPYTVTVYNATGQTITGALLQGYLSQGAIVDFGAGGTTAICEGAPAGEIPPGACTLSFQIGTRTLFDTPAWSPGDATFRLEFTSGSTLLDSKSLIIKLNIIQ